MGKNPATFQKMQRELEKKRKREDKRKRKESHKNEARTSAASAPEDAESSEAAN